MAMDNFLEEVATKRNKGSQTIAYIFANVLMILSGIWAFITLQVLMYAFLFFSLQPPALLFFCS